jgi:hypothetical protein
MYMYRLCSRLAEHMSRFVLYIDARQNSELNTTYADSDISKPASDFTISFMPTI